MEKKLATILVNARAANGILLEQYTYTSGAVEPLPKHAHEEYQFGLSFNCQGEYRCRGAYYSIPKGCLSAIHPGAVHSPSDRTYLPEPATFWMVHIHPTWFSTLTAEMAEKPASLPCFPTVLLADRTLNRLFFALQLAYDRQVPKLEQELALWDFLAYLITCHASNCPAIAPLKSAPTSVIRARDYLHAHYTDNISLEELAAIAGLSRFHFCRMFHQKTGLSPSAYQTQLRIAQAKKLLLQGLVTATVAALTGFYDQSHFGRTFKRWVGVTPKAYTRKTAIMS